MYNEDDYKDSNNINTSEPEATENDEVVVVEDNTGIFKETHRDIVESEAHIVEAEEAFEVKGLSDTTAVNEENGFTQNMDDQRSSTQSYTTQSQDMHQEQPYPYTESMSADIPQEPIKKRKKRGIWKKAAGLTAAGILFGLVAGGTMVGVTMVGDYLSPQNNTQIGIVETMPNITTTTNNSNPMDVSTVSAEAMPSIVAITNTMLYQNNWIFGESQSYEVPSSGSGIIVGQNQDELLIVTNNHVIENSESLKVTFIDNSTVDAAVKGTDSEFDLAVIAIPINSLSSETLSAIKVAKMGSSDDLKVGQGVIAIGNALGYGQSLTVGYVSALNRQVATDNGTRTYIQTDAAINPGNSGGALLNMKGELIGINAAKSASMEVEGIGYAIPITFAQEIINDLMNKTTKIAVGTDKEGFLGIQGQNIDAQTSSALGIPQGVYVYKILENSPASGSGLREKDIITKFDNEKVSVMADIQKLLTYYSGDTTITLTVQSIENGQYVERNVDVTLGFKKDSSQQ